MWLRWSEAIAVQAICKHMAVIRDFRFLEGGSAFDEADVGLPNTPFCSLIPQFNRDLLVMF